MALMAFVQWDRFVETFGGGLTVYGWIARADGRDDFVLFIYSGGDEDPEYYTSSAERSIEIGRLLWGPDWGGDHVPCRRVESAFKGLRNVARVSR